MGLEKCLIIAEAGVNHNGDINLAFKLCDEAKRIGADVVKFQTYKTEEIITNNTEQAEYQKENTGRDETQYELLKRLELSYEEFRKIKEYCDLIGIKFASTGDTIEDVNFLLTLDIPFIKIGSSDIGNIPFLRYIGTLNKPSILSTGMRTLDDIEYAVSELEKAGTEDITLLHCTTSYPCADEDVNLKAINTLVDKYGLPVGYSDHTIGSEVAIAAVALGAKVIEKHLTLDTSLEGPDHMASTPPDEFARLVNSIRRIERAMGDGIKRPTDIENSISAVVKKRIVARKEIKKGNVISEDDISVMRSREGMFASRWDDVVGSIACRNYHANDGIII